MEVKFKKTHYNQGLDIKTAVRAETYISPTGNKQNGYIFNCLNCNKEMFKTPYYAKKCFGFCKSCNKTNEKPIDTATIKTCKECNETKDVGFFNLRENGRHRRSTCQKCMNLKASFGINDVVFVKLLKEQNGVCAICKNQELATHQNGKQRTLAVDHCHTTGKVRGLLCTNCNTALGGFKDNTDLLEKAIAYLKER